MSKYSSRVMFVWAVAVLLSTSTAVAQDQTSDRLQVRLKPDPTSVRQADPTPDPRWTPWLGCWIPLDRRSGNQDIQVCVLPTSDGAGVSMMTFAGNQRILDEPVRADGSPQLVDERECAGSIQNTWSRDGARVFRVTELRCEGKTPQRTSGLSTMSAPNEWLDLQVALVDGRESVRTRRYVRALGAPPAAIEEDIRRLGPPKISVLKTITVDDVVEAHAMVSSRAVEAWLAEADARVPINRRALMRLEEGDVARAVIDLMVALAYPKHFEVRRPGSASSFGSLSGFDGFGMWSDPLGLSYDPYAYYYSPFGPYYDGLNQYSLPYAGYVTIPEPGEAPSASGRGKVVKGSGYTQVETRQPPPSARRSSDDSDSDTTGSSSRDSSPSSGDGGGSASPGGYSSGGSGGGQTAVPR